MYYNHKLSTLDLGRERERGERERERGGGSERGWVRERGGRREGEREGGVRERWRASKPEK